MFKKICVLEDCVDELLGDQVGYHWDACETQNLGNDQAVAAINQEWFSSWSKSNFDILLN